MYFLSSPNITLMTISLSVARSLSSPNSRADFTDSSHFPDYLLVILFLFYFLIILAFVFDIMFMYYTKLAFASF